MGGGETREEDKIRRARDDWKKYGVKHLLMCP